MWTPTETDYRIIAEGLAALSRELARKIDRERNSLVRRRLEDYNGEVHAVRRLAEEEAR